MGTYNLTTGNDFFEAYSQGPTVFNVANLINADAGLDFIVSGAKDDTVNAGDDADLVFGSAGNDLLNGDAGNDTLDGGNGNNTFNGGTGFDTYVIGFGAADLGNNIINDVDGTGKLFVGEANYDINNLSSTTLVGFELTGTAGAVIGQTGKYDISLSGQTIHFSWAGDITNINSVADLKIWGTDFNDTQLSYTISNFKNGSYGIVLGSLATPPVVVPPPPPPPADITGTEGNDGLNGNNNANIIYALGGNDTVKARGGDDVVSAGAGNDNIMGADGNDRIYGEDGNDSLWGGADNDTISGGNDSDFLVGGAGDDSLSGGAGRDYIQGSEGNDIIKGGADRDSMEGGAGADKFVFSAVTESTSSARDIIYDFVHGVDKIDVSATDISGLGDGSGTTLAIYTVGGWTNVVSDTGFHLALKGVIALDAGDFLF